MTLNATELVIALITLDLIMNQKVIDAKFAPTDRLEISVPSFPC
jgi:hypothetical protein